MTTNFFPHIRTTALLLTLITLSLPGQSSAQAPSLQEQLIAQYPLATTAKDGCNVGNPETALTTTAKGGGIRVLPVSSNVQIAKCTNSYANGQLKPASSACNGEAVGKAGGWLKHLPKVGGTIGSGTDKVNDQAANQQLSVVKTGDTVYPSKLEVNENKGEVKLTIITCQQGNDGSQNAYKGELAFQFKAPLKVENISTVEDSIAEVFTQGGDNQQGGQGNQQGQGGQGGQSGGGPQQGQDQAQPQQDQGSTCNPEIGQTVAQVEDACGKPASQAKGANTKQIYNYNQPKLKIIFMNGKVSDVE